MAIAAQNDRTLNREVFPQGSEEKILCGKSCVYCALSILQLINIKVLLDNVLTCDSSYNKTSFSLAGIAGGFSLVNFCAYITSKEEKRKYLFLSFESVVLISTLALAILANCCTTSFSNAAQEVLMLSGACTFLQIINLGFSSISDSLFES